jgi:hypothetical protein
LTGGSGDIGASSDSYWLSASNKTFKIQGTGSATTTLHITDGVYQSQTYTYHLGDIFFIVHGDDQDGSPYSNGTSGGVADGGTVANQIQGEFTDPKTGQLVPQGGIIYGWNGTTYDSETWEVFYTANYQTGQLSGGYDVAIEAVNAVPEASTMTMLAGAALMGLGYAGVRRLRRRKGEDGDDSTEADEASETAAS